MNKKMEISYILKVHSANLTLSFTSVVDTMIALF